MLPGPLTDVGEAVVLATRPTIEEVATATRPVFLAPPMRRSVRAIVLLILRTPLRSLRALRRHGVRLTMGTHALRETAVVLGLSSVCDLDGHPQPALSALLPPLGHRVARPLPVGLAMIVQDEEAMVGDALRSVEVTEKVVVDGGSTDGTVALCRDLGATVVEEPFVRDFARQRNVALATVQAPWTLFLDGDEVATDGLVALLEHVAALTTAEVILIPRHNEVDGVLVDQFWPDLPPRAMRTTMRYFRKVHEQLLWRTCVALPLNGPVIRHMKTSREIHTGTLLYAEIDPDGTDPEHVAHAKAKLAELDADEAP